MDPLSDVLSLLKLRSYVSGGLDAGGDWAVSFGRHDGIKFHAVVTGSCWISVEGESPVRISAGECFLLPRGRPFRIASDLSVEPVHVSQVMPPRPNGRILTYQGGGDYLSIGGYFTAETDHTTGDLFGGSRQLRNENSPSWLIKQAGARQSNILVVVSTADRDSYRGVAYADGERFIAQTRGTPGVATIVLPSGGHSFKTYRPTVPASLSWLQQTGSLG